MVCQPSMNVKKKEIYMQFVQFKENVYSKICLFGKLMIDLFFKLSKQFRMAVFLPYKLQWFFVVRFLKFIRIYEALCTDFSPNDTIKMINFFSKLSEWLGMAILVPNKVALFFVVPFLIRTKQSIQIQIYKAMCHLSSNGTVKIALIYHDFLRRLRIKILN